MINHCGLNQYQIPAAVNRNLTQVFIQKWSRSLKQEQ